MNDYWLVTLLRYMYIFFSPDFGSHPVIVSYIIVYTCWFCLKNLSLSDDSVFIGGSDKLQTDHMTCWVMQRGAFPSPGCVSVYNWSALRLLCFLRSPMTVSRGLRLGGPPPLERSAALVGTLWFLYYPLFLPPIPSCPSPPFLPFLPPLPPLPRVAVLDVMSIVIALGVTTPETSYSDMAAGSEYVFYSFHPTGWCTYGILEHFYIYIYELNQHPNLRILIVLLLLFLLRWLLFIFCHPALHLREGCKRVTSSHLSSAVKIISGYICS